MRDVRRRHASRGSGACAGIATRLTVLDAKKHNRVRRLQRVVGTCRPQYHLAARAARTTRPVTMSPPSSGQQNSFIGNLAASAFSASFAEACTIPLDTAKVRLQLQGASAAGGAAPKYNGMFGTMMTVAREEGAGALWKGIPPGTIHSSRFARRRPPPPTRARASRRARVPRRVRRDESITRNGSSIDRGADPLPNPTSQASIARSCSAVCASACTSPSRTCTSAPTTWATSRFT